MFFAQKEFVSVSTGFIGFCLFNMIVFLISFLGTLLEDFNINMGPSLAWQLAMAVTPTIWITRNRNIVKTTFSALAARYHGADQTIYPIV